MAHGGERPQDVGAAAVRWGGGPGHVGGGVGSGRRVKKEKEGKYPAKE
jgi:hypothetical protein